VEISKLNETLSLSIGKIKEMKEAREEKNHTLTKFDDEPSNREQE